jgi:tetratricopeptide (TPR) repeat protein
MCRLRYGPGLIGRAASLLVCWAATISVMILLGAMLWAAPPVEGDRELPPPRTLPQELQPPAPTHAPGTSCRPGTTCPPGAQRRSVPPAPSDAAQSQQIREALEQLRQERERLRQVRQQPHLPPPDHEAAPGDTVSLQVQRLLWQWVLNGATPANAHTSSEPRSPPSAPASSRTGPARETTFPTGSDPTAMPADTVPPRPAAPGKPAGTHIPDPAAKHSSDTASPRPPSNSTDTAIGEKPIAPMELAQMLFRAGNYEGALAAFRLLDTTTLSREDRLLVQYLQASCLRKLGRHDEALQLLREIANSRTDAFAVECARWQLTHLRWQQETQRRLTELRSRREHFDQQR